MDAYEATKIVYQRIQNLDPQNASKIMGFLLIQDHGEKEMIRLAFGPESLLHSVILKANQGLNTTSLPSSPLPLSRQNSSAPSRLSWMNSSNFSDFQNLDDLISPNSSSSVNSATPPFYGEVDLIDELHLQDQLSFLNDTSDFYTPTWGVNGGDHQRSCSISDIWPDDLNSGFGWKPCLFYARGYCKNGTSCRFLHDGSWGFPAAGDRAMIGSPNKFEMMEQYQEMLRSKSTYSSLAANKSINYLQFQSDGPRGVVMNDGMQKFGRNCMNPISRQIYLTFPADSTFKEEDVSNYFSNFGPVQDVRIPYQQKRMFGFVTFDYPETVKLILAKGNPHFVCDARVLVKPYKEKGKIADRHRKPMMERGEFDSRDGYDLQLGPRMFNKTQDTPWRRKLEEQAHLQQAIELQNRRLMGLHLLDVKRDNLGSSPPTYSPTMFNLGRPAATQENGSIEFEKDDDFSPKDNNLRNSFEHDQEHNLPDSPFASDAASEKGFVKNNLIITSSLDMATPFKSCYFQLPRFASGHETIGM